MLKHILTMTVITLPGNSCASIANRAVKTPEHPRASTPRTRKHITINIVPSGHMSSVLKVEITCILDQFKQSSKSML